jgi:hypothetical protein
VEEIYDESALEVDCERYLPTIAELGLQFNFYEVRLAGRQFALLLQKLFTTRIARFLVRWAEDFDRGCDLNFLEKARDTRRTGRQLQMDRFSVTIRRNEVESLYYLDVVAPLAACGSQSLCPVVCSALKENYPCHNAYASQVAVSAVAGF